LQRLSDNQAPPTPPKESNTASFESLKFDDSTLQSDGSGVSSIVCIQFGEDALDPALDRLFRNREPICDLLICVASRDQTQDFDFSVGK
jgi:hypothetical protein